MKKEIKMSKPEDFITISLTLLPSQLALVYATLAGSTVIQHSGVEIESLKWSEEEIASFKSHEVKPLEINRIEETEPNGVDTGSPEVDAHGHTWSELLHASTKGTTKDGLWRMKPGVTRPAPMPGFPIEEATSTTTSGEETQPVASASTETAQISETSTVDAPQSGDEDDEFAAFTQALKKVDAAEEAAVASVPARKWTDADLGALCNQAAQKLGDPAPIKEIIGKYVPEGEVAHSRNIPENAREEFAKAVEAKASIEFAG
jgi:hypothetical protein